MPDAWYYSTREEQVGPITLQELKNTLPTLPNVHDVYIWHDSLTEWIRAGDLAEIVARKSALAHEPEAQDSSDDKHLEHEATDTEPDLAYLDELHLEELHPDPAYAITMPPSSLEEAGNAAKDAKGRSIIGLLVGSLLFVLGFGLVCLRLIGVLPRANSVFALAGALLLVAGFLVIWFRRSKSLSQ